MTISTESAVTNSCARYAAALTIPAARGFGDCRVRQIGRDQLFELGDQAVRSVRRKIQTEPLDRDELLLLRIVRPKNRTEGARADLMENAKWTEGVRRRSTGGVGVQ